jgi:hypothetical protein
MGFEIFIFHFDLGHDRFQANASAFAYFIGCDDSLPAALKSLNGLAPKILVFGGPALHPLAPSAKTGRLQMLTHAFNHCRFGEPKLNEKGLERGAVFPGHFYYAINIRRRPFRRG